MKWFKEEIKTKQIKGSVFMHVPLPEFTYMYNYT